VSRATSPAGFRALLSRWRTNTRASRIGNYSAANLFSRRQAYLGIAAVSFSAIAGTSVIASIGKQRASTQAEQARRQPAHAGALCSARAGLSVVRCLLKHLAKLESAVAVISAPGRFARMRDIIAAAVVSYLLAGISICGGSKARADAPATNSASKELDIRFWLIIDEKTVVLMKPHEAYRIGIPQMPGWVCSSPTSEVDERYWHRSVECSKGDFSARIDSALSTHSDGSPSHVLEDLWLTDSRLGKRVRVTLTGWISLRPVPRLQ